MCDTRKICISYTKYIFKVSRFEKFQTITQNRILFIIYIGIISKVLKRNFIFICSKFSKIDIFTQLCKEIFNFYLYNNPRKNAQLKIYILL